MDLITPSAGLLLWTSFAVLSLIIGLVLIYYVWKRADFDQTTKLLWTLLLFFIPLAGIILYLFFGRKRQSIR